MPTKKKSEATEIHVTEVNTGQIEFCLIGRTPLIFNAVSEKARHELLMPLGRKTAADKQSKLKHDPIAEYRNSVYANVDDAHPTRLMFPAVAFKKAMSNAALDLPGLKKAQIGRLVWVEGINIDVYGIPQLYMTIVRSADMAKTPDVRTRAIVPSWAARITATFVQPLLRPVHIGNLLGTAGLLSGIGDGRQEKGTFSYGQWRLGSPEDADFQSIVRSGGRAAQDAALRDPASFDLETQRLLSWFEDESEARGMKATVRDTEERVMQ